MQHNSLIAAKERNSFTSLERFEGQILAISGDRAQGDAWEKALKGWINAGGHLELTKAWMWGEWPGKLKAGLNGDKGVDLIADIRDKHLIASRNPPAHWPIIGKTPRFEFLTPLSGSWKTFGD